MLLLTETGIVVSDGGEKDRKNLFRYNRSELNENEPMKKPRKGKLMRKVRGYVCMYDQIQTTPDYGLYLIRG